MPVEQPAASCVKIDTMTQTTPYIIDKTGWPDGPWMRKPDRIDWVHAGFACMAIRNRYGNWCGYVGVPAEHPAYGQSDPDGICVHGGLTYAARCAGPICHVPQPGMPDDVWWLGFDCGHCDDFSPGIEALLIRLRAEAEPTSALRSATGIGHAVYRDVAYVRAEVQSLAEQLAACVEAGLDR